MTINPYTTGFGQRPLVVVGRERQLARGHETLLTVAGTGRASTSPLVLLGVRGIGKTVALGLLRDDAEREGFVTVLVRLDRVSSAAQLITSGVAEQVAVTMSTSSDATGALAPDALADTALTATEGNPQ